MIVLREVGRNESLHSPFNVLTQLTRFTFILPLIVVLFKISTLLPRLFLSGSLQKTVMVKEL